MSHVSNLLLRLALSFAFLYPAYGFWTNPHNWIGYLPSFVKNAGVLTQAGISESVLAMLIAGVHLIIALWLLSGWRIFIPSLISAVFLGSVVYFNQNQLDVLFRDLSLALVALSLAFGQRRQ